MYEEFEDQDLWTSVRVSRADLDRDRVNYYFRNIVVYELSICTHVVHVLKSAAYLRLQMIEHDGAR